MKEFRTNRGLPIENAEDFGWVASEIFERFLQGFSQENGLLRPIAEDDVADESWDFVYTDRGARLAERMRKRLSKIGEAHFPDEDIYIESSLYQEI